MVIFVKKTPADTTAKTNPGGSQANSRELHPSPQALAGGIPRVCFQYRSVSSSRTSCWPHQALQPAPTARAGLPRPYTPAPGTDGEIPVSQGQGQSCQISAKLADIRLYFLQKRDHPATSTNTRRRPGRGNESRRRKTPGTLPPATGLSPSRCRLPRRHPSPPPRRPPRQCLGSPPVSTEREREAPAPAAPLGGTHPRRRPAPPSCRGRGRAARSGSQRRGRVVLGAE